MTYPEIDPVALHLGPLLIRWYALAYLTGLLGGWAMMRRMVTTGRAVTRLDIVPDQIDDFLTWATLGVVGGGRLGYVLFYKPEFYLSQPSAIFRIWEGGMSFHGGCLGVIVATIVFAHRHKIALLALGDMVATGVPIGLFFGRIANFINGELYGRPVAVAAGAGEAVSQSMGQSVSQSVPWAMVFPHGGPLARHPSQLYEASLEGAVLFVLLWFASRSAAVRQRHGVLTGLFLAGYGVARFTCEFFREPDAFLGYLWGGATMGQLLSLPMIAVGAVLVFWAARRPPVEAAA